MKVIEVTSRLSLKEFAETVAEKTPTLRFLSEPGNSSGITLECMLKSKVALHT